jgi:hypothetical protein
MHNFDQETFLGGFRESFLSRFGGTANYNPKVAGMYIGGYVATFLLPSRLALYFLKHRNLVGLATVLGLGIFLNNLILSLVMFCLIFTKSARCYLKPQEK